MNSGPAWPPGVIAILGAVGAAVMYLAGNAWFGAGDLWAMVFWSLPLGVLLATAARLLSRRLASVGALGQYAVFVPLGALLGFLWTTVAALILGGWIGAFSFPVLFCWVVGGIFGGIAEALNRRRHSWPAAVVIAGVVLATLAQLNAYARAPEPRVRVVVKPGATPAEVQRVWTDVLGQPTERPNEHDMLPGLSSVAASGFDGESAVLTVSFRKSLRARERDSLVALIRRSPLVARIDRVPETDTSGVRSSVSY